MTEDKTPRKVVAQALVTMDGYTADVNDDVAYLFEHAVHPETALHSIYQELLRAELLDELRITVLPAVLGAGGRLFSDDIPQSRWRLAGVAPASVASHPCWGLPPRIPGW